MQATDQLIKKRRLKVVMFLGEELHFQKHFDNYWKWQLAIFGLSKTSFDEVK